jgi:mannosyl-oligosaccharide glucosidase
LKLVDRKFFSATGFDDFPRPDASPSELHVDLISWMAYSARVLAKMSLFLGDQAKAGEFEVLSKKWIDTLRGTFCDSVKIWVEDERSFCDVDRDEQGLAG